MVHILAAGDEFVAPELFVQALQSRVQQDPQLRDLDLSFAQLRSGWPSEPFGQVAEVTEASGEPAEVLRAAAGAEIIMTQMAPLTDEVFRGLPQLRMVGVCRGGPVNVNLEAATAAGVPVSFAPGRNAAAAAEFAVGLMLAAMRHICAADAELKSGNWRGDYYAYGNAGIELDGATVGLVGYGAIGRIVARVMHAFGATVLVADPYLDAEAVAGEAIQLVELDELLRRSSVVSLHARLTAENHHLLDAGKLALLPRGAVLVNSARGGLLDYQALPEALRSGALGAVALDVYDHEPPPADWPLHGVPNVITTPHLAGATRQTAHRAAEITAGEVARFLGGESLAHLANPEVLERPSGGYGNGK